MSIHGRRPRFRIQKLLLPLLCLVLTGILTAGVLSLWLPIQQQNGAPPTVFNEVFKSPARRRVEALHTVPIPDRISREYIPTLGTARTGDSLSDYTGVVIHYVGNPATTAAANRNYFSTSGAEVCSHFVVGLEGEILQCLPLWERSVASNHRNRDTISIEVCHPDDSGRFTDAAYESTVWLTAWLCHIGGFSAEQVLRHYDVSGKECPRYYVKNEQAWEQLKQDVEATRKEL